MDSIRAPAGQQDARLEISGRSFVEAVFIFAKEVQRATDRPLADILQSSTPLHRWFDSKAHYERFLDGVEEESNPADRIIRTRDDVERRKRYVAESNRDSKLFGPFTFDYVHRTIIIHFANRPKATSPLSDGEMDARIDNLRDMFSHIKQMFPGATTVRSTGSWLLNLEQYTRLFPLSYRKSIKERPHIKNVVDMGLWGQLVDHKHQLKQQAFDEVLRNLRERGPDNLEGLFKYPVCTAKAPIQDFYNFYKIK